MNQSDASVSRIASLATPCSSPPMTPDVSASDSEWSTTSEWPSSSAPSSRAASPFQPNSTLSGPVTKIATPAANAFSGLDPSWMKSEDPKSIGDVFANFSASQLDKFVPKPYDGTDPSHNVGPSRRKNHIPRPPNAFMLFRKEAINPSLPGELPNRQQMVSIIAGQCWNMLGDERRAQWHEKAREILKAHMAKHPDYKFSPSRKTSRKAKGAKDGIPDGTTQEEYLRQMRMTYIGKEFGAPAAASSRSRKAKSRKTKAIASLPLSLPSSASSSPSHSPAPMTWASQLPDVPIQFAHYPPPIPNSMYPFPAHGAMFDPTFDMSMFASSLAQNMPQGVEMPHNMMPSPAPQASSCGSGTATPSDLRTQQLYIDDDKTPTAASFGNIAMPRLPQQMMSSTASMLGLQDLSLQYAGMYQQTQASSSSSSVASQFQDPGMSYLSSYSFPMGDLLMGDSSARIEEIASTPQVSSIPAEVQETFGVKPNSTKRST